MLRIHEGYFLSFDQRRLFYRLFENEKTDGRLLVILHGHGEHSGRYEKFFSFLKDQALSIALFDFRGHGKSEGPEVYVDSFEEYLQDVSSFVQFLADRHGFRGRIFLLGHSLGGLVAVHWALRNGDKIERLILSSPCLGLSVPRFLIGLNEGLNRWVPRLVFHNPVHPPYLTHDKKEVERYRKDKEIRRKISVRLLSEVVSYITRLELSDSVHFDFPVYCLMAEVERVVDKRKTMVFFEKVKAPVKEMKFFPGFFHEIFNELGQEKVFEALIDYLKER